MVIQQQFCDQQLPKNNQIIKGSEKGRKLLYAKAKIMI